MWYKKQDCWPPECTLTTIYFYSNVGGLMHIGGANNYFSAPFLCYIWFFLLLLLLLLLQKKKKKKRYIYSVNQGTFSGSTFLINVHLAIFWSSQCNTTVYRWNGKEIVYEINFISFYFSDCLKDVTIHFQQTVAERESTLSWKGPVTGECVSFLFLLVYTTMCDDGNSHITP